ncbi:hypothetical protein T439DRAFT_313088 [Meredithblackwellia eburnea MCA 4105]
MASPPIPWTTPKKIVSQSPITTNNSNTTSPSVVVALSSPLDVPHLVTPPHLSRSHTEPSPSPSTRSSLLSKTDSPTHQQQRTTSASRLQQAPTKQQRQYTAGSNPQSSVATAAGSRGRTTKIAGERTGRSNTAPLPTQTQIPGASATQDGTQQQRAQPGTGARARDEQDPNKDERLVIEKFTLYETKTKLYIVAFNQSDTRYKVLKLDRNPVEDDDEESEEEEEEERPHHPQQQQHQGGEQDDKSTTNGDAASLHPNGGTSTDPVNAASAPVTAASTSTSATAPPPPKLTTVVPPPPTKRKPRAKVPRKKTGGGGLNVTEDAAVYSRQELDELLAALGAGNAGGITRVVDKFYGIAGFIKFTTTYYMIMITRRAPVALLGGHYIYHCEETVLRAVNHPPSGVTKAAQHEEQRLLNAFQGVDLSKNFYFSYTYDLTHTLQHNLTSGSSTLLKSTVPNASSPRKGTSSGGDKFSTFNDKWVWNRHLLRPAFRSLMTGSGGTAKNPSLVGAASGMGKKSPWVLPLVHGFVDQAKLSVFGRTVYITLIARRSRHFAGARFLKRGVNEQGYVANDVETEQIVSEALTTPFYTNSSPGAAKATRRANPRYTSFVQVRGSIPLYWSQESTNMSPKPPIELSVVDPYFAAAALHFDDLLGRYGGPITVLNLIKQKERQPRESKLFNEFGECINYLNGTLPQRYKIKYQPWDIANANKQRDKDVIGILEDYAEEAIESTNFFHTGSDPNWLAINKDPDAPPHRTGPLLQFGVIRTNCIDCLDRTNAAQFVIGKAALGHQLLALGIIHDPYLPFDSDAVNLITEMFHDHGDTIALQYGGSHLVNTMDTYRKIGQWTSHSRDTIENLRRYYTNSFVDADKQAAIDLFLGIDPAHVPPEVPIDMKNPPPPRVRRHYRNWFTPAHLDHSDEIEHAAERIADALQRDDDFWQTYYRPKLFTDMSFHFAFQVNSTAKYIQAAAHTEEKDQSPFTPRIPVVTSAPKINVGSGVRRWITHRGRTKTAMRTRIHSQRIEEASPAPPLPLNTTEAMVGRLLKPFVADDEAREYASYIDQFDHLSLSQDLSEKDALLYRSSAAIGNGADGNWFHVDRTNLSVYVEAVRTSSPGQALRGTEVGSGLVGLRHEAQAAVIA